MTTAVFQCVASGTPTPSYRWQVSSDNTTFVELSNGGVYSTVDTFQMYIDILDISLNGMYYRCRVYNANGSILSRSVLLTVTTTSAGVLTWSTVPAPPATDYNATISYDTSSHVINGPPTNFYGVGTFPAGYSVNQTTGYIEGVSKEVGTKSVQILATTDTGPLVFEKSGVSATDISWVPPTQRIDNSIYGAGDHYGYELLIDSVPNTSFPTQYATTTWSLDNITFPQGPKLGYVLSLKTIDTGQRKSSESVTSVTVDVLQPPPQEEDTSALFNIVINAISPEWGPSIPMDFFDGETVLIELSDYIVDDGGNNSLTFSLAPTSNPLPSNLSLVNSEVIGTISGITTGDATFRVVGSEETTPVDILVSWSVSNAKATVLNQGEMKSPSTSYSLDFDFGFVPTDGNILIANISRNETAVISPPDASWTQLVQASHLTARTAVYWKIASGDAQIQSWSVASGSTEYWAGGVVEISNATAIDAFASQNQATVAPISPEVTTTAVNTLILAGFGRNAGGVDSVDPLLAQRFLATAVSVGCIGGSTTQVSAGLSGTFKHSTSLGMDTLTWTVAVK